MTIAYKTVWKQTLQPIIAQGVRPRCDLSTAPMAQHDTQSKKHTFINRKQSGDIHTENATFAFGAVDAGSPAANKRMKHEKCHGSKRQQHLVRMLCSCFLRGKTHARGT